MAKMKVVQVPKAGADFEIVEREIPHPGAGHVRIQVFSPALHIRGSPDTKWPA